MAEQDKDLEKRRREHEAEALAKLEKSRSKLAAEQAVLGDPQASGQAPKQVSESAGAAIARAPTAREKDAQERLAQAQNFANYYRQQATHTGIDEKRADYLKGQAEFWDKEVEKLAQKLAKIGQMADKIHENQIKNYPAGAIGETAEFGEKYKVAPPQLPETVGKAIENVTGQAPIPMATHAPGRIEGGEWWPTVQQMPVAKVAPPIAQHAPPMATHAPPIAQHAPPMATVAPPQPAQSADAPSPMPAQVPQSAGATIPTAKPDEKDKDKRKQIPTSLPQMGGTPVSNADWIAPAKGLLGDLSKKMGGFGGDQQSKEQASALKELTAAVKKLTAVMEKLARQQGGGKDGGKMPIITGSPREDFERMQRKLGVANSGTTFLASLQGDEGAPNAPAAPGGAAAGAGIGPTTSVASRTGAQAKTQGKAKRN